MLSKSCSRTRALTWILRGPSMALLARKSRLSQRLITTTKAASCISSYHYPLRQKTRHALNYSQVKRWREKRSRRVSLSRKSVDQPWVSLPTQQRSYSRPSRGPSRGEVYPCIQEASVATSCPRTQKLLKGRARAFRNRSNLCAKSWLKPACKLNQTSSSDIRKLYIRVQYVGGKNCSFSKRCLSFYKLL